MRSRTCVVFYLWPRAGGTTFSLSFKARFPMKAQSPESSSTITTIHKQRGRRFLLYASLLSETKYVAFYKRHKRQFDHSAIFLRPVDFRCRFLFTVFTERGRNRACQTLRGPISD